MRGQKLYWMEPGLVKISYDFAGVTQEEFALILTHSLANCVDIPNSALCYRFFLREGMKAAEPVGGLKPIGPFSGHMLNDEYIEEVSGRKIRLSPFFSYSNKNFNPLLIPRNSQYFNDAVNEMKINLLDAGFNVDASHWEEYKAWELKKLRDFQIAVALINKPGSSIS